MCPMKMEITLVYQSGVILFTIMMTEHRMLIMKESVTQFQKKEIGDGKNGYSLFLSVNEGAKKSMSEPCESSSSNERYCRRG